MPNAAPSAPHDSKSLLSTHSSKDPSTLKPSALAPTTVQPATTASVLPASGNERRRMPRTHCVTTVERICTGSVDDSIPEVVVGRPKMRMPSTTAASADAPARTMSTDGSMVPATSTACRRDSLVRGSRAANVNAVVKPPTKCTPVLRICALAVTLPSDIQMAWRPVVSVAASAEVRSWNAVAGVRPSPPAAACGFKYSGSPVRRESTGPRGSQAVFAVLRAAKATW